MSKRKCDFEGWATRFNRLCADGRTILDSAFKHQDGTTVPLIWSHQHNDVENVLGHVDLEYRPNEGMWAYGYFNNTQRGQDAKEQVAHGDIRNLSIHANHLKHDDRKGVMHGEIREVSLVLAGANPGAFIMPVLSHGDVVEDEGIIYVNDEDAITHTGLLEDDDDEVEVEHADAKTYGDVIKTMNDEQKRVLYALVAEAAGEGGDGKDDDASHSDGHTYGEVIDTMNDEQRAVLYSLVEEAAAENDNATHEDQDDPENNMKEDDNMSKKNVFEHNDNTPASKTLTHSDITEIIKRGQRGGSLHHAFTEYVVENGFVESEDSLAHGITDIESLFPDPKELNNPPEFIKRDTTWAEALIAAVHKSPMTRIRSTFADITEDEARARGYIKGKFKKEEFFSLLRRSTSPTTVYKKQSLHRDDVMDITDFDVIRFIKGEMGIMLNEELARAYLIGDGRLASDEDHIDENCIRPIYKDDDLFNVKVRLTVPKAASEDDRAKAIIRSIIKARKSYKGSGNPWFFTTEDYLTDMLLLEDKNGRVIYDSVSKLMTHLRVSKIITVPVMENQSQTIDSTVWNLVGIIVNPADYNVGADRGGETNFFDDFDIDYNKLKYLMETRRSGALTKPFSAMTVELAESESASATTLYVSSMADGLSKYKPAPVEPVEPDDQE